MEVESCTITGYLRFLPFLDFGVLEEFVVGARGDRASASLEVVLSIPVLLESVIGFDVEGVVFPLVAADFPEAGEFEGTTSCAGELGIPGDGRDIGGGNALVFRSYFFFPFQLSPRQFAQGYSSSSHL